MTGRIRIALRPRERVVFIVPPVPAWVPEPDVESARRPLWAVVRAGSGRFQPVEEAALRTVSDASAVMSVVRR